MERYDPKVVEPKWQKAWEEQGIYRFDEETDKEVYSIDTPPPTVSGSMHIGHAFSYTQSDFIARFQRMRGKQVFFPFGTDDNGIATERLIEKMHNVRAVKMDRRDFTKLCLDTLEKIRPDFVQDWKNIGMSCDWSIFYSTIDKQSQAISQRSFIELYKMGREYRKDAPALYCPECRTAVSQVETQDKEMPGFFNDIVFKIDGEEVVIATTRPEYLAACVAVFYHPDDKRYQKFQGKTAIVPIFGHEVPVMTDKRVNMEKGTGIMMCCTFGDQLDMEWYFAYDLPLRSLLAPDGRLTELAGIYKGMKVEEARKAIVNELKQSGALVTQKPIMHAVNVHERCSIPIEIMHTKQWFIKYLDIKEDMLEWGRRLEWHPPHMRVRYENWINGLQWDWLISRQRFHGIPFPVWYCAKCEEVILAKPEDLPVDPTRDKAPVERCPKCHSHEIIPEKDVLDTWATSSLSPQLAVDRYKQKKIYSKIYPMSLRPQAHDIITFWLFNTVVKSQLHHKVNPWHDVVISGHAQDPHGKKMSKSKGNVVDPQMMIQKYSADALRFWAAGSKLGDDMPFQEKDLVTGIKFATKIWNASSFCKSHLEGHKLNEPDGLEVIDLWLLTKLNKVIDAATRSFQKYEYSRTKQEAEKFFWHIFCDYYLELVKDRLYNKENYSKDSVDSARYTLHTASLSVLKLMAPIMPYITEEIYQGYYAKADGHKSIHLSNWPEYKAGHVDDRAETLGDFVVEAVSHARRAKTERQLSMKAPIQRLFLKSKISIDEFESVKKDIMSSTNALKLDYECLPADSKIDFEAVVDL
jgi:valyl-tRNA synthetase